MPTSALRRVRGRMHCATERAACTDLHVVAHKPLPNTTGRKRLRRRKGQERLHANKFRQSRRKALERASA
jgi:hypothetical protein